MKISAKCGFRQARHAKQRGVSLFFALIALLVISLAAVALIRSVDTSTLIAGNLAFKQSTTSSGDAGIEAAVAWLAATEAGNTAINVMSNPTHPFNNTGGMVGFLNSGYYSSTDSNVSLTDPSPVAPLMTGIQWSDTDSTPVGPDNSGNTTRYVIQRMCRNINQPIQTANCLFSGATIDKNGQSIPLPQDICVGAGCPVAGQAPQLRITSRTAGPRNSVSYVQAFVY